MRLKVLSTLFSGCSPQVRAAIGQAADTGSMRFII